MVSFLETSLSIILICGFASSWYFIKKKPDEPKRNYSVAVTLISILLIGFVIPKIDNRPLSEINTTNVKTNSDGEFTITGKRKNTSVKLSSDDAYIDITKNKKDFEATVTMKKIVDKIDIISSEGNEEKVDTISVDNTAYIEQKKKNEEKELAKQKAEKQAEIEKEKEKNEKSDITKLSKEPTSEQKLILSELANNAFTYHYPYKGSKMHSVLGVIQDWTENDGKWFYKVEATIVNGFGAERKSNVEVHITPESPDSGTVEFVDY